MTTTTPTICPPAGCQAPSSSTPTVLSTNLNIHEAAEGRLNFPLAMTIIRHLGPEGEKPLAQLTESSALAFFFRFLASPPHHRIFVLFIPDITSLSDRRRKKKGNNQDYLSDSLFCITSFALPSLSDPFSFLHHQHHCIISSLSFSLHYPPPPHHPNKNESLTFQSTFTYIRLAYTPPLRHGLQIYVQSHL